MTIGEGIPMHPANPEDLIYEAALVPELWPALLQHLADLAGSEGAVAFCAGEDRIGWVASPTLDHATREFVRDGWVSRNSRIAAGFSKGLVGARTFMTEADLFGAEGPDQDPLYTEFFRPRGLGASAGVTTLLPHGDVVVVSIERDERRGPVPQDAVAVLNGLVSHLKRAAMIAGRLQFERLASAVSMLSGLGFPSAAVDARGRVLVMPEAAGEPGAVWSVVAGDRLLLADKRAQVQLDLALAAATADDVTRSIPLRASGQAHTCAVLQVVPVRRHARDLFGRASAVVIATTPRQGLLPAAPIIQALFDLTPAEVGVVIDLGTGAAPKAIARRTGRSVETVRNQIKSVLRKTGCARSSDLVRLIGDIAPRQQTGVLVHEGPGVIGATNRP